VVPAALIARRVLTPATSPWLLDPQRDHHQNNAQFLKV